MPQFFRSSVLLVAVLAATAPLLLADDASKTAKIEEMLTITQASQLMDRQLAAMEPMIAAQMKQSDLSPEGQAAAKEMLADMTASMRRMLSWERLKPIMVRIYSETFTEQELDGIVGFYKSPAGQAMLAKMPLLMNKTMQEMSGLMGDLMQDVRRTSEELARKYPQKK